MECKEYIYRVDFLMTVSRELSKYKIDLVECRRSDGRAVAPNLRENTHFCTEREKRIIYTVQGLLCIKESAVKRVLFVCGRMSYIILRCRLCHMIVMNYSPTEDKTDDVKEI
jgi:hypothetical protein